MPLGVEVSGVVAPLFVDYVADTAEGAESVGSLFEPDFEAIAAGGYDLLVAGGRSSRVVPDLAEIAPTIDMTIWEDTVGQGLDRLAAYGEIFDKQDEAAALRAEFDESLAAAKAAVAGQGNAMIVMTNGPTVSAYGAAGRSVGCTQHSTCPKPLQRLKQPPTAKPSALSSSAMPIPIS